MDARLMLAIVLVCLYITTVEAANTEGKFQWDGRQCTWKELGAKNSHDRTLRVGCKGNKKKKIPQLSCQYEGDPHPCAWYNQKNQAGFYACLVVNLAANQNGLCAGATVSCHNHCQDIVFTKKSSFLRQLVAEMEEFNDSSEDSLDQDY